MKLLKRDRTRLLQVLTKLKRAEAFILSDRTAIMRQHNLSSTDIFTAPYYPDEKYVKITKDIGSDLVSLFTGIRDLENILTIQEAKND